MYIKYKNKIVIGQVQQVVAVESNQQKKVSKGRLQATSNKQRLPQQHQQVVLFDILLQVCIFLFGSQTDCLTDIRIHEILLKIKKKNRNKYRKKLSNKTDHLMFL